jgi:hypothetical protein
VVVVVVVVAAVMRGRCMRRGVKRKRSLRVLRTLLFGSKRDTFS